MENKATTQQENSLLDLEPQEIKTDLRRFNKAEDQVNKALAACSTITPDSLKSQTDVDNALDILKKAKQVETVIENKRKELVKPLNDDVKRINDYAKKLTAKIDPAIRSGKEVILSWQKEQEQKLLNERTAARHAQLIANGFIAADGSFDKDGVSISLIVISSLDDSAYLAELKRVELLLESKRNERIAELNKEKEGADFFGDDTTVKAIEDEISQVSQQPIQSVKNHVPAFGPSKTVKGVTKTWTYEVVNSEAIPREFLMIDDAKIKEAIKNGTRSIAGINIFQKESLSLR